MRGIINERSYWFLATVSFPCHILVSRPVSAIDNQFFQLCSQQKYFKEKSNQANRWRWTMVIKLCWQIIPVVQFGGCWVNSPLVFYLLQCFYDPFRLTMLKFFFNVSHTIVMVVTILRHLYILKNAFWILHKGVSSIWLIYLYRYLLGIQQ